MAEAEIDGLLLRGSLQVPTERKCSINSASGLPQLSVAMSHRLSLAALLVAGDCQSQAPSESAEPAIAAMNSSLAAQSPDFEAAYYYLLAALRTEPGSPDVFFAATDFVEKAAQAEARPQELAADVLMRCETLISFQEIEQIPACVKRIQALEEVLVSPVTADYEPFETINEEIQLVSRASLPGELVFAAIEGLQSQLTAQAFHSVLTSEARWSQEEAKWIAASERLQQVESKQHARLFRELEGRCTDYLKQSDELFSRSEAAEPSRLPAIAAELSKAIEDGRTHADAIAPYVSAQVEGASDLQERLAEQVEELIGSQEWNYNRHALSRPSHTSPEDEETSAIPPSAAS